MVRPVGRCHRLGRRQCCCRRLDEDAITIDVARASDTSMRDQTAIQMNDESRTVRRCMNEAGLRCAICTQYRVKSFACLFCLIARTHDTFHPGHVQARLCTKRRTMHHKHKSTKSVRRAHRIWFVLNMKRDRKGTESVRMYGMCGRAMRIKGKKKKTAICE